MSIFPSHDIETMNEDDVSGEIIRPFCRALGYTHGNPNANMRSQISLQYDKVFLGHKNGQKDPMLRGRPDFVCEVVSHTRWVIEAKAPHLELSDDDSYQAHTYATHPEIAADFYILANGREFRLYKVGKPKTPIWDWKKEDTDDLLPALIAFLGPEAMKKKANVIVDKRKPIANGIPSAANIVGGHVVFSKNRSTFADSSHMDGLVNTVTGNRIFRADDGIFVEVSLKSAFAEMDAMFDATGFYPLRFSTATDEYLSTDREKPTMMQNIAKPSLKAGTMFPKTPISPGGSLPFDMQTTAYTEALGFFEDGKVSGTFTLICDYEILGNIKSMPPFPLKLITEGIFEFNLAV